MSFGCEEWRRIKDESETQQLLTLKIMARYKATICKSFMKVRISKKILNS